MQEHLVLPGQLAHKQGRVDQLGHPHQPGEEAPWLLNTEPGSAVPQPAQLTPPSPTAPTVVGDGPTPLHAPGAPGIGHDLEEEKDEVKPRRS